MVLGQETACQIVGQTAVFLGFLQVILYKQENVYDVR